MLNATRSLRYDTLLTSGHCRATKVDEKQRTLVKRSGKRNVNTGFRWTRHHKLDGDKLSVAEAVVKARKLPNHVPHTSQKALLIISAQDILWTVTVHYRKGPLSQRSAIAKVAIAM